MVVAVHLFTHHAPSYLDQTIATGAHQPLASTPTKRNGVDHTGHAFGLTVRITIVLEQLVRANIPDFDGAVGGAGGDQMAGRVERHVRDHAADHPDQYGGGRKRNTIKRDGRAHTASRHFRPTYPPCS